MKTMISTRPEMRPAGTEAAAAATLQVDVIADLICPWCYLGKRRLADALAAVRGPSHARSPLPRQDDVGAG